MEPRYDLNSEVQIIHDSIVRVRLQSSFAVKQVRQMLEPHVGRNRLAVFCGKKRLDGSKIRKLKEIFNQFYPAPKAEALET